MDGGGWEYMPPLFPLRGDWGFSLRFSVCAAASAVAARVCVCVIIASLFQLSVTFSRAVEGGGVGYC
jgi:hypothetical protein